MYGQPTSGGSARAETLSRAARAIAAWILIFTVGVTIAEAEARPRGTAGPEADMMAQRLLEAVNDAAWTRTGAVRWTFRGDREHLWDRHRSLARVRWDKIEVLLDLTRRTGLASRNGDPVNGPRGDRLVEKAYAHWINDSFWLNPVSKIFDTGTERSVVEFGEGQRGLLVEYTSGGLTPGDAFLWIPGPAGLPTEWRMWTSNLPVGGTRASWEGWQTLSTGALVATRHKLRLGRVDLADVAGTEDLAGLMPGPDPFSALVASKSGPRTIPRRPRD